jgi:hypothetical protein
VAGISPGIGIPWVDDGSGLVEGDAAKIHMMNRYIYKRFVAIDFNEPY